MTSMKEQIESDLDEAQKELQELERQLDDRPVFESDEEGSANAYAWEMLLARKERVLGRIESLQGALSREQSGEYGRCDNCGAQIDPERLEILPATRLCVSCARGENEK